MINNLLSDETHDVYFMKQKISIYYFMLSNCIENYLKGKRSVHRNLV